VLPPSEERRQAVGLLADGAQRLLVKHYGSRAMMAATSAAAFSLAAAMNSL
jgi:hypothetical protein